MSTVGMIILILYRTISPLFLRSSNPHSAQERFRHIECIIMNAKICRQVLL